MFDKVGFDNYKHMIAERAAVACRSVARKKGFLPDWGLGLLEQLAVVAAGTLLHKEKAEL